MQKIQRESGKGTHGKKKRVTEIDSLIEKEIILILNQMGFHFNFAFWRFFIKFAKFINL